MTTKHITKEELLRAVVGDTFLLIDNINEGMRFDGNSFVDGMESDTPLTINGTTHASSSGVYTKEIVGKGYTYDMIKAIFRNGKLLFGNGKEYISHDSFIKSFKKADKTPSKDDIKVSRNYITDEEYMSIESGDTIIVRNDIPSDTKIDGNWFWDSMTVYDKEENKIRTMTAKHKPTSVNDGFSINENDCTFYIAMIKNVIKKK